MNNLEFLHTFNPLMTGDMWMISLVRYKIKPQQIITVIDDIISLSDRGGQLNISSWPIRPVKCCRALKNPNIKELIV